MNYRIDNALEYILHLLRHLPASNVPQAIEMLLCHLNFEVHLEGFEYTKQAIYLKSISKELRISEIHLQIIQNSSVNTNTRALEQSMRQAVKHAWSLRNEEIWTALIPEYLWKTGCPSSGMLVTYLAYLICLWSSCAADNPKDPI